MNAPQLSHINPQDSKYLITQTGRSPSATWAAGEKNIRNQSSKVTDDVPIFQKRGNSGFFCESIAANQKTK